LIVWKQIVIKTEESKAISPSGVFHACPLRPQT